MVTGQGGSPKATVIAAAEPQSPAYWRIIRGIAGRAGRARNDEICFYQIRMTPDQ
jgi:hypothetical protein